MCLIRKKLHFLLTFNTQAPPLSSVNNGFATHVKRLDEKYAAGLRDTTFQKKRNRLSVEAIS